MSVQGGGVPSTGRLSVRVLATLAGSVAAVAVVAAGTWSRLAQQLAIRWDPAGRPDAHLSTGTAVGAFVVVPAVIAALTVVAGARPGMMPLARRAVAALGVLFTVLSAADGGFVLVVNAAYGADARLLPFASVCTVIVAFAVTLFAVPGFPGEPAGRFDWRPPRGLAVLWQGTAKARWALPTSAVFAALAAVAFLNWSVPAGVAFAFGALIILSLVAVVVEVDERALRVRYFGGVRWPASRIPLSTVSGCRMVTVNLKRAGWGYRGSFRLFSRASVNLRSGPAIRLDVAGGRRFVVTVDDAEEGCEVLRALLRPS